MCTFTFSISFLSSNSGMRARCLLALSLVVIFFIGGDDALHQLVAHNILFGEPTDSDILNAAKHHESLADAPDFPSVHLDA